MPSSMNFTRSRKSFRLFFCLCLVFTIYGARSQPLVDTLGRRLHYRYSSFTILSGDAWQFFSRRPGILTAQFPYSVTDASGGSANSTFYGQIADPYGSVKSYPFPLLFEFGRLHHFANFGLAFPVVRGDFGSGVHLIAGYGFLVYPGWRWFAIKLSLSMTYTTDLSGTNYSELGNIDNRNKTVYVLGLEADPTFTTGSGTSRSPSVTHTANNVRVAYSQREAALLPRISFAANPYRGAGRFEILLGYNLPFYDGGGIAFDQQADNGDLYLGRRNINNKAMVVTYQGRPIVSAPYRFGGMYVAVLVGAGSHKSFVTSRK